MEDLLIEIMSQLGPWWVEGINQHVADLCVDLTDYTARFRMSIENAEKILKRLRTA